MCTANRSVSKFNVHLVRVIVSLRKGDLCKVLAINGETAWRNYPKVLTRHLTGVCVGGGVEIFFDFRFEHLNSPTHTPHSTRIGTTHGELNFYIAETSLYTGRLTARFVEYSKTLAFSLSTCGASYYRKMRFISDFRTQNDLKWTSGDVDAKSRNSVMSLDGPVTKFACRPICHTNPDIHVNAIATTFRAS